MIKAKVKNMKQIFSKRLTDDEEVTIREPYENRYSVRVKDIYKVGDANVLLYSPVLFLVLWVTNWVSISMKIDVDIG